MSEKVKSTEFEAYGVKILRSSDPRVRILKRKTSEPVIHGQKIWGSSLLLMDYFQQNALFTESSLSADGSCPEAPLSTEGSKVLEAGCGWGLTGIYAAQKGARVTAVDADQGVFPYLELHGDVNQVQVTMLRRRFETLRIKDLEGYHLVFGGDVCFWDELVDIWYKLIGRAFRAGVKRVVLADPGRTSFHELAERCLERWGVDSVEWSINHPRRITGYILDIKKPD